MITVRADGVTARARRLLAGTLYVLCMIFGSTVLWLALWVAAPAIGLGWGPTVLHGDSMAPVFRTGDVVLSADYRGAYVEGTIITYDDPASPGRLTTHRIHAVNEDGSYVTKGDGNRGLDSTPVPPENVRGAGRILVPLVGLPVVWWHAGEYGLLALFGAALVSAGIYAWRYPRTLLAGREELAAPPPVAEVPRRIEPLPSRESPDLDELRHRLRGTIAAHQTGRRGVPVRRVAGALVSLTVPALLLAGLVVTQAVGWLAFSEATGASATLSAADSFAAEIAHVKTVGTATCGGSSSPITVPAGGVAAGNTLVIRFVIRNGSDGAVTATDTRGNTYVTDAHVNEGSVSNTVLSGHVATALQAGDVITVSHPSHDAEGVVIDEFSGIAATDRVDAVGSAIGTSASPSVAVSTTSQDVLLYGALSVFQSPGVTEAAGWTSTPTIVANCKKSATGHGAHQVVATSGNHAWNPTLGTSIDWAGAVVAYKAGSAGPDTTAPGAPTLSGTAGDGQNSLSWTSVSDPSTPVSYQLYRDGDPTPIYDGTATSHVDTGLDNGTSYSYVVRATDGADNQSGDSNAVALTPSTDPYAAAVGDDGPVAWWRLGEASGTTATDATTNGHDGTYQGSPTLGEPGLVAGGDTAVSLHGSTTDHVSVPDAALLDGHVAMTWEIWVEASNLGGEYRPLLCKRTDTNTDQAYCLYVDGGTNQLLFKMGGSTAVSSTGALSNAQPAHVVVTFDGAVQEVRFYLDGALDRTVSYAHTQVPAMSSALFLGAFNTGDSRTLDGRIDEVAIYDRVLTGAEIAEHHTAGVG